MVRRNRLALRAVDAVLPSSQTGWRDGVHFARELADWTIQYESEVAVPTPTNDQYVRVYVDCRLCLAEGDMCFPEEGDRI